MATFSSSVGRFREHAAGGAGSNPGFAGNLRHSASERTDVVVLINAGAADPRALSRAWFDAGAPLLICRLANRVARRIAGLALLVLAATPLAGQTRATPKEIARAVDSLASRVVLAGVSPGLGVAIAMNGRTIFAKAYGWADVSARISANDRTLWYVASTSKSFTGFATALLAHQGAFTFDAPITRLLPRVKWPDGVDAARLTLAHFLSHTHHINDNAVVLSAAFTGAIPEERWPDLIRYATPFGNDDLIYTNFGYNIAAMVIDRVRHEGWKRYLDSAVCRPAGLRETYTHVSRLDARRIAKPHDVNAKGEYVVLKFAKADATMNAAGGHLATLHDLARWVIVQMDSGRIDGMQVFPREAVVLSHGLIARQTRENAKRFGPFDREGWAAGWDIGSYNGERMVSRFGSYMTTRSHLSFLPARRVGVVAQANGPAASGATDIVAAFVYDLEAGRSNAWQMATQRLEQLIGRLPDMRRAAVQADSVRRARQRPLEHSLSDFAGSYYNEQYGTLEFYLNDGALRYRWGVLDGPTEVYDAGRNVLRIEIAGAGRTVTFDFDPGRQAAQAVELGNMRFRRADS